MPRSPLLPYVWMLCGCFSFAIMAVLVRSLKEVCDWQEIAIARTGLAMMFAASLALGGGAKLVYFRPAKLWVRSIAGSISLLCGFYAMTHYPVSEVLTLTNMFPLWVAVLSWPLLGEYAPLDVWPAVGVGIVGVLLIQLSVRQENAALMSPEVLRQATLAMSAALLSAFTSAIAMIGLHRLKEIDARSIVAHFSGVALIFSLAAMLVSPRPTVVPLSYTSLALLVGVGISATVGQLFLTRAFTHGSPSRISVIGLSQVGFAMLLEIAIFHRTFTGLTLVGMALAIAPTAWILLRRGPASAPAAQRLTSS
jgi:drug/metabolite transporter (DMT)-like permease